MRALGLFTLMACVFGIAAFGQNNSPEGSFFNVRASGAPLMYCFPTLRWRRT